MKKLNLLLPVFVLMFATAYGAFAQSAQERIDAMRQEKQQLELQGQRLQDAQVRRQQHKKEFIGSLNSQMMKEFKENQAKGWKKLLRGTDYFDPEEVEDVLLGEEAFETISWGSFVEGATTNVKIVFPLSRLLKRPYYAVFPRQTQIDIPPSFVIDTIGIYTRKYREHPDAVKKMVPGAADIIVVKEPALFVVSTKKKCVIVFSDYRVKKVPCDTEFVPYEPIAQERMEKLREIGFSQETVENFGAKQPWNLKIYAGCADFDGHQWVEKVVMAWRYVSVSNNKEKDNHKKDIRYVYVKSDGQEREEGPIEVSYLPNCKSHKGERADEWYASDTQPMPGAGRYKPTERKVLMEMEMIDSHGGCGGASYHSVKEDVTIPVDPQERAFELDDKWYF